VRIANVFASVDKRILMIMAGATLGLCLVIVGLLWLRDYRMDKRINRAEEIKMAYDAERLNSTTAAGNRSEFLYPEMIEELDLGNDPYRSRAFRWDEGEVKRLWIEPDAADIDYFEEANHRLIWEILKDAP
jgi:hypothetical protein